MRKMVIEKSELVGFEKGKDYEILTVSVFDMDCNTTPYGRFSKKNILDLVRRERLDRSIIEIANEECRANSNCMYVQETRPLEDGQQVYILTEDMIDLDTAVDCGFGIIRLLNGKHKGYYLYNSENEDEDIPFMLDVYLQVAIKDYDNKGLERYINTKSGRALLRALQNTNDNILLHKLDMAFQSKKGGDNVITFKGVSYEN